VEDTGKGIPEAAIKHIFERFVTGANTGAGLGLSICHELINYMGGEIQLKSTEGKGTTVWFTLPCKLVEMERI
jgi:signal transduction histidine kinase